MDRAELRECRQRVIKDAYERGWGLIALKGKRPIKKGWPTKPALSVDEALAWSEHGNLGLPTGERNGIWIIDDDTEDGSGAAALDLPPTAVVRTGSKKWHHYFKAPEIPWHPAFKKAFKGVDLLGDKAQAVFPGSLHPATGGAYRWEDGQSPDGVEIADLPQHILDKLLDVRAAKEAKKAKRKPKAAALHARSSESGDWSSLDAYKEQVRDRSDIVEVIGRYTEINNRGMTVCPLHDDTNPSLSVSPEGQVFHCFGCEIGGDVFAFVMQKEGVPFVEAVKILAEQAGMEPYHASTEEIRAAEEEREIADILTASAFFYSSEFRDPKWKDLASEYSWPDEHREKFELGWAEGGLKSYLINLGFPLPACLRAGVLVDHGGEAADALMDQLVLPVRLFGRVTALIGVDLECGAATGVGAEGAELPLFNEAALDDLQVYLVTDVLDALALEAWGLPAVAILAPGFDPKRVAEKLGRAERVTICFEAGTAPWPELTRLGALLGAKAKTAEFPTDRPPRRMRAADDREAFDRCVAETREPIIQAIEAIPAETAKLALPDLLSPVLEALADLPHAKAEAYLAGDIKKRFGLIGEDLNAYRRTIRELRAVHQREAVAAGHDAGDSFGKYTTNDHGTFWNKTTRDGPAPVKLANFSARIAECVTEDDGAECLTTYKIEVRRHGQERAVRVPAASFAMLSWVHEELGPEFIVEAGMGLKDHMRTAIQYGSGPIQRVVRFSHIGWRKVDKHGWLYLSGSGPVGTVGTVDTVEVALEGALACYALELPKDEADVKEAVRASMAILMLGPDEVLFPLFASIWRATLGGTDFALHLAGPSGTRKTATAAVIQAHFGREFDERRLPGSWSSTANAIEGIAFLVKDAIFVVDDFAPTGTAQDRYRFHRDADRVFRGQGNLAGRARMNRDGSMRVARPPRGMILSTGEDVPTGQSLRARTLVLEISPGMLDLNVLTKCQEAGRSGLLCKALAAFVQWAARDYEKIGASVKASISELRDQFQDGSVHGRTATIAGELLAGFEKWLGFVVDCGEVEEEEATELRGRCIAALKTAVRNQAGHVTALEPATRFVELLSAAIASGEAHIAGTDGLPSFGLERALGWRRAVEGGVSDNAPWVSQGRRVGWTDRKHLLLDPTASFKAAQAMATGTDGLAINQATLGTRLVEMGLIVKRDAKRQRTTARVTIQKVRREVWVLRLSTLCEQPSQPSQSDQSADKKGSEGSSGTVSGDGAGGDGPATVPGIRPSPAPEGGEQDDSGVIGTGGTVESHEGVPADEETER